jgi:hypothetical protein
VSERPTHASTVRFLAQRTRPGTRVLIQRLGVFRRGERCYAVPHSRHHHSSTHQAEDHASSSVPSVGCRRADWNTTPTGVHHVAGTVELHRDESPDRASDRFESRRVGVAGPNLWPLPCEASAAATRRPSAGICAAAAPGGAARGPVGRPRLQVGVQQLGRQLVGLMVAARAAAAVDPPAASATTTMASSIAAGRRATAGGQGRPAHPRHRRLRPSSAGRTGPAGT